MATLAGIWSSQPKVSREMFARKDRYAAAYTHRSPSRDPELRLLLEWMKSQPGNGLVFVTPQMNQLENSPLASAMVKSRHATHTSHKNRGWQQGDRIIALWPHDELLRRLDDAGPSAFGVLTWNLADIEVWAPTVGAIDLLGLTNASAPTITDLLVLGAMRSITDSINLSSGISHPSDWNHAVTALRELRSRGCALNGTEVETWAVANGWSSRHAADLSTVVAEVAAGKAKRLKPYGSSWSVSDRLVDHWRDLAARDGWGAA